MLRDNTLQQLLSKCWMIWDTKLYLIRRLFIRRARPTDSSTDKFFKNQTDTENWSTPESVQRLQQACSFKVVTLSDKNLWKLRYVCLKSGDEKAQLFSDRPNNYHESRKDRTLFARNNQ